MLVDLSTHQLVHMSGKVPMIVKDTWTSKRRFFNLYNNLNGCCKRIFHELKSNFHLPNNSCFICFNESPLK